MIHLPNVTNSYGTKLSQMRINPDHIIYYHEHDQEHTTICLSLGSDHTFIKTQLTPGQLDNLILNYSKQYSKY